MATLRKLLFFLLAGAALGDLVAMLWAPSLLAWYATPVSGQALCVCADTVKGTIHSFIQTQAIGALIGAVLLLIAGIFVLRASARRNSARQKSAGVTGP